MRALGCFLSAVLAILVCSSQLQAQDKKRRPGVSARAHRDAPAKKTKAKPAKASKPEKTAVSNSTPSAARPESSAGAPPPPRVDADEENVRKEGGTEVKTLEFGGLDIEGQLKTPQMLYFLNRLRAEFERPQLPHRSFMPELQRTTKENTF